jgi:crotonobetainyl-CoA:carnitine CoA-transferase CaiB-like acyl-CoA transferase
VDYVQQALSDVVVLDLTRVLAGPYGTMVLGDFGADIIKVEQPGRGDDTRQWGPPFNQHGESAYFLSVNRNKKSITLDLKQEAGRAVLRDLVQHADILIENFKVGMMASLGLDYEHLREINPTLIYCAITGYGQNGPYRHRPGYDAVIQAQGGIMSITGDAEGEPFKVGVAIVDITAGMYAVMAILAALHHRHRTDTGQLIDIALFDNQLGWLANVGSAYLTTGKPPTRHGNAHATIVPYQTFATADGGLMLAVGNDGQYTAMCHAMGHPALSTDARFRTNPERVVHRAELIPLLDEIFRTRPTHEWVESLLDVGVPCGPINDIPTALNDPQTIARGMVQYLPHPRGGMVGMVGPVPKMSETPPAIQSAPPALGEHTDHILREILGYDERRIADLYNQGVCTDSGNK